LNAGSGSSDAGTNSTVPEQKGLGNYK